MSDLSDVVKEGWLKRGNLEKWGQSRAVMTKATFKRRAFILLHTSIIYLDSPDLVRPLVHSQLHLS